MVSTFSRILVATDFSPESERAWRVAQRLAAGLSAELVLLHVLVWDDSLRSLELAERQADERSRHVDDELNIPHRTFETEPEVRQSAQEWAEDRMNTWAAGARGAGLAVRTLLRDGTPHREIVAAVREQAADLVVLSTHGRGGIERALIGSVADRVVRTAPCPVMTVRNSAAAAH